MWLSLSLPVAYYALFLVSCSYHLMSLSNSMTTHLPHYLIILLSPLKYDFLCAPQPLDIDVRCDLHRSITLVPV